MSYRLEKLFGASVANSNGEIGRIKDVYFDDQCWAVRYLVVGTGIWLTGSGGTTPYPVGPVGLLPPIGNARSEHGDATTDPHLRSAKELAGYHLLTSNDSVGHVEDFLLDKATWAIRYLVIDTRNWLPGKHVLIPPQWIRGVDWLERVVNVDVSRDTVQTAPEYHSALQFSRLHETNLYSHYQRPGYWQ